jgi:nucleotide-binding universal stress UspA family protein
MSDAALRIMLTPTRILVPVDFSSNAEQALDYAIELAGKLGATIHVLNVIGIPVFGVPELGVAVTSATMDSMVRDNQTALDKLVASRKSTGVKFSDPILRTGDARDVILQTAEEIGADLIVMGTHGRRGLSRALLGSVTEMVVRTSNVPVLTIRGRK